MARLLKVLFFASVVRPLTLFMLGLNVKDRHKLPLQGPAVIAANHNSHLDTMVLMSLYPLAAIHRVRPVAAADYFLKNKWMSWFSRTCIGIIPLDRSGEAERDRMFDLCREALDAGEILILFPEGSRGEPERISPLKKGLYHLVADRRETCVVPVVMHGLGRALPKGEAMLVPFNCDVVVGDRIEITDESNDFVAAIRSQFDLLLNDCVTRGGGDIDPQI